VKEYDILVTGRIVQPSGVIDGALGIDGSTVVAVHGPGEAVGRREIGGDGLVVLPGGVDPHVHVAWPYGEHLTGDDFASASVAALHGGTTSIIDFAYPRPEMAPPEYLAARRVEAASQAIVDFALHTVLRPGAGGFDALVEAGSTSWKVYLTYSRRGIMSDDGTLVRVMEAAAERGVTLCVHAENGSVADAREKTLVDEGERSYAAHYRHKPWWVEAEAVERAIFFAGVLGCRLHFKHLSTHQGVELVRAGRARGVAVSAETCPHYLSLTEAETAGADGPLFLCSPPLRGAADRDALWEAMADRDGVVCVGADHCDFTRAQKHDHADDFRTIPNGLPGIETRLYVLYQEGVRRRGLSLPWLADVFSTSAARIFGLAPRKGSLEPGADADVVVFDPEPTWTIDPGRLHMQADWSPYAGREVSGRVRHVIRRGAVVFDDGKVTAEPGTGRYVHRVPFASSASRAVAAR
jgi:dihydropyrimidinase